MRPAGEVAAGLYAAARALRARHIVAVDIVGGDQAPAADVGALDHVILDQWSRNNGVDHRLLALLARVTGKLGDAPPAAQMTELALHGTKQYIA